MFLWLMLCWRCASKRGVETRALSKHVLQKFSGEFPCQMWVKPLSMLHPLSLSPTTPPPTHLCRPPPPSSRNSGPPSPAPGFCHSPRSAQYVGPGSPGSSSCWGAVLIRALRGGGGVGQHGGATAAWRGTSPPGQQQQEGLQRWVPLSVFSGSLEIGHTQFATSYL